MEINDLYQKIVNTYLDNRSVKQTAKVCKTTLVRAQRVLITEGLWSSKTSRAVAELFEQNLTVHEIADKLCVSVKTVQAYLPYTRGQYGGSERTDEAIRSEEYRLRMRTTAEKIQKHIEDKESISFMSSLRELKKDGILEKAAEQSKDRGRTNHDEPCAFKLHLELIGSLVEETMAERAKNEVLKRRGKVEKSISRDIIVPATMTFHSLHYAIQKLFGWQNSHLHNFFLPEELFMEMTGDKFAEYCRLSGVYFRFPTADMDDLFWDDDYEEGLSFKTWLRKKYNGPYRFLGFDDQYPESQRLVKEFFTDFPEMEVRKPFSWKESAVEEGTDAEGNPTFKTTAPQIQKVIRTVDATMKEAELGDIYLEQSFNYLLERLTIADIFTTERVNIDEWKEYINRVLEIYESPLAAKRMLKDLASANHMLDEVMDLHMEYRRSIEMMNKETTGDITNEKEEETWLKSYELVEQINRKGKIASDNYEDILEDFTPLTLPVTDTVYYKYDYGDNWKLRITCDKMYYDSSETEEMPIILTDEGQKLVEEKAETVFRVAAKEKPICIAKDGLDVLDDVGGMDGFCNFLSELYGNDKNLREENKIWARGQGWTGRQSRPEKTL